MTRRLSALLVIAATLAGMSVCAEAAPDGLRATTLRVKLQEFKLLPAPKTAPAGKVAFAVRNAGRLGHDFVVLKTNLPPSKLPVMGARAREVGRVGKIPEFPAGKTKTLRLTLGRGRYVLICNVPGHYRAGMFAGFRVR